MHQTSYYDQVSQRPLEPATRTGNATDPAPVSGFTSATLAGEAIRRQSLSKNFNREIDAWARHALAASGFGDIP